MNNAPEPLKNLSKLALAVLALLFIGGIVFYKERILFADSAFKTFNIINYKMFSVSENRYGSFITQVVPYAMMRLHLSAKAIIKAYAFGFNLFYLLIGIGLVYKLRQYSTALIMAAYFTLFVSSSYFWPNDELHQAIAYLFLFMGSTLYMGQEKVRPILFLPVFITLIFLSIYTHFIAIIPLGFLWVYMWLDKKNWPFSKGWSIALSAIIILMFILKIVIVPSTGYDMIRVRKVTHFSLQDIIDVFSTSIVQTFFIRCLTNYWVALLAFVAGVVSLVQLKQRLLAAFSLVCFLGYIIIIGLTYSDIIDSANNVYLFHIETEWACIGVIAATPFVYSVIPRLKPKMGLILLGIIFVVRLGYIYSYLPEFTWRTLFKKQVLAQMKKKGINKLAIINNGELMHQFMLDWAISEESLLTSAIKNEAPLLTFTFIDTSNHAKVEQLKNHRSLFTCYGNIEAGELSRVYFPIDTVHPYQIMTYDELIK